MTTQAPILEQASLLTLNINSQTAVRHPVDGYDIHPLYLDRENGVWVLYARFPPGTKLPKHFHTGTVHFFTTKGAWNYVEHPQDEQTAGSYLFEPGGSVHTFSVADDAEEAAEGLMVVNGANINFDENGSFQDILDAGEIETAILGICNASGITPPAYIKPGRNELPED